MNDNTSIIRPLIGIMLFFLLSQSLWAQQYKTARTTSRVYYEGGGEMQTVQVVSQQDLGDNDTAFTFYTVVDTGVALPGNCDLTTNAAGWLGSRMVVQDSLINLFFNAQGDTIRFRPGAALGNTYPIYQFANGDYIDATNIGLQFGVFIDSFSRFKTIQLQARDAGGQAIAHPMNGQTMEFSERFGMKKGFNLLHFPNDTTSYRLIGHELSGLGQRPLNVFALFDIRPGYEFHFIERLDGAPFHWEKQFVLNAFDIGNSDTLQLEVERWITAYTIDANGTVVDTTFSNDTITRFIAYADYSFLNGNQRQVFEYATDTFGYAIHRLIDSTGPRFRKDIQRPYTLFSGGLCLEPVTDSVLVEHYGDGLGLTALHLQQNSGRLWQRDMVYYQVGIEQWGEMINFSPLGISKLQYGKLEILPNPTQNQFQLNGIQQPVFVQVFTLSGQVVLEKRYVPGEWLTVGDWPAALYLIRVVQEDNVFTGRLLKQ